MASGPCGTEFKEAFSCFHYSQEEVKGSDCLEQFRGMQECLQRYPELYPQEDSSPSQNSQDSTSSEPSSPNQIPGNEQNSDTTPPNTETSEES